MVSTCPLEDNGMVIWLSHDCLALKPCWLSVKKIIMFFKMDHLPSVFF